MPPSPSSQINSFTLDQHPNLRADYVMANPPFNIKERWDGKLEGDTRWKYSTPPQGNANFAWVQHMLHHTAPNGSMALPLANGSMSSNSSGVECNSETPRTQKNMKRSWQSRSSIQAFEK